MTVKSILWYPGAKAKVADFLLDCMPDGIEDWREPFFGGGSMTLAFLQSPKSMCCKKLVVGDLFKDVWAVWKAIQECPDETINELLEFTHNIQELNDRIKRVTDATESKALKDESFALGRKMWAECEGMDRNNLTLAQRGARMLFINRSSFSGMGYAGTPTELKIIKFDNTNIPTQIRALSGLLQGVEILNASFEVTMQGTDKDKSFIFLDPPYYAQGETSPMYGGKGKESTHTGFPHDKLRDLLMETKCKWLMTYDDSVVVRKLYEDPSIFKNTFHIDYVMNWNKSMDALAGEELLLSNYELDNLGSGDDDDASMNF